MNIESYESSLRWITSTCFSVWDGHLLPVVSVLYLSSKYPQTCYSISTLYRTAEFWYVGAWRYTWMSLAFRSGTLRLVICICTHGSAPSNTACTRFFVYYYNRTNNRTISNSVEVRMKYRSLHPWLLDINKSEAKYGTIFWPHRDHHGMPACAAKIVSKSTHYR